jgi:hypothetical protein
MRSLASVLLIAGLAAAPVAQAKDWRDHHHGHPVARPVWHGDGHPGCCYHHGGNGVEAAVIGGLIGLGIGAAVASGGEYGPPPGYYGPPPPPGYGGY